MSWLGKFIGGTFGFLMGGPMGALFGAAVGHQFDQGEGQGPFQAEVGSVEQYKAQMAFFTAVFSVMGHIAKADGRVNEAEIEFTRKAMTRMQLNEDMRKTAMRLFNEGKRVDFPLDDVLRQFRSECQNRFNLLRYFVELQLELALSDSVLHAAEERLLSHICERLHFSRFELHALKTMFEAQFRLGGWQQQQNYGRVQSGRREPSLADSYVVLGLDPSASDQDIRRAYRRLLSRHHPDKLAALGANEEKVRLANEKTHEIRQAWDIIRKVRNL
ncbi:MAG: co-chaperone DjlA [Candidatus Methylumidiphilus alinenensis]|uniref:Co-chaperone protein DjlA n=1 Tax=Candidatus Methylumidiphilus alinenensis TaxID=2202197 RepID=A0A2W4R406_9GAMM|nr:MAG: co-chaperone DjlA [Candidatus Methylumidiphilus alinenensis]